MTFVSCGWYLYTLFCYIHKNNFNLTPLLLLVGLIIYTSTDPTVSKTLKNFDIFLKNNTIGVLKVSMNTEDHITYYHSSEALEIQNSSFIDWLSCLHKYQIPRNRTWSHKRHLRKFQPEISPFKEPELTRNTTIGQLDI